MTAAMPRANSAVAIGFATTPSMPVEFHRERRSATTIAPLTIVWHARGGRGLSATCDVELRVHAVEDRRAELEAHAIHRDGRRPVLTRQWVDARVLDDGELVHIDCVSCGHEPPLLRMTVTPDRRLVFVQSALPSLAGLAAGRYEPAAIDDH